MRITYDRAADAAYIYLVEDISPGSVKATYPIEDVKRVGQINLDFNVEGILVGIEVLDASKKLPGELLKQAQQI